MNSMTVIHNQVIKLMPGLGHDSNLKIDIVAQLFEKLLASSVEFTLGLHVQQMQMHVQDGSLGLQLKDNCTSAEQANSTKQ